jgi:hypothetical protein
VLFSFWIDELALYLENINVIAAQSILADKEGFEVCYSNCISMKKYPLRQDIKSWDERS